MSEKAKRKSEKEDPALFEEMKQALVDVYVYLKLTGQGEANRSTIKDVLEKAGVEI